MHRTYHIAALEILCLSGSNQRQHGRQRNVLWIPLPSIGGQATDQTNQRFTWRASVARATLILAWLFMYTNQQGIQTSTAKAFRAFLVGCSEDGSPTRQEERELLVCKYKGAISTPEPLQELGR